jgi:glycerate 2-kinase
VADLKQLARTIFDHALRECSIDRAFDRNLHVTDSHLQISGQPPIALNQLRRVRILAIGKAAAPMLDALLTRLPLPPTCDLAGILISPTRPHTLPANIQHFPGGHPYPNESSFAAASAALAMLRAIAEDPATLCLFLISGGASAMMELPLDPAISLADTIAFHRALVSSGATIVEINCLRKHFSAVKGGRLALAAGSARKLSLLVSDVPPAHLDALASGPTLPDTTTVADCREILTRYALLEKLPPSVQAFFTSPTLPETPKPHQLHSPAIKLLDSEDLAAAARAHAAALGFHAIIDNTCDDWPSTTAADYLLHRLRELRRTHPRVALISTGEVTVELPPSPGTGGRNQHLALTVATHLHPADAPVAILSAGSDGIDGNSPAAGAVLDTHSLTSATSVAAAQQALAAFDSTPFLNGIGATITTGPTGHNLRDLRILLAENAPQ